jgi:hypothetical protein
MKPWLEESTSFEATKVHIDQRHPGRGGGIGHRLGGRSIDRVDDDRIDARGDEVVDLVKLLGHIILRVFDLHRQAGRIGLGLDAVAQHGQKVVVELCHRHTDALCQRGGAHQAGKSKGDKRLFHFLSSTVGVRRTVSLPAGPHPSGRGSSLLRRPVRPDQSE